MPARRYYLSRSLQSQSSRVPKTLYLFPDTNVFVQCRSLDQLNWGKWADVDEVRLIVARPVQVEIDKHKSKGSDRLAERARATSRLFREIVRSPERHQIIRPGKPALTIELKIDLKPAPALADRLDYDYPDDRLVGIVQAFADRERVDARVLTHDAGPMASAKMVGVPCIEVPEYWLLPPETTKVEKKIRSLESEIKRLRLVEPAFHIRCRDTEDREVQDFEAELVRYTQLSDEQVSQLLRELEEGLPMTTDFGPQEPPKPTSPPPSASSPFTAAALQMAGAVRNFTHEFVRASDDDIAKYRAAYPEWLNDCGKMLSTLHEALDNREPVPTLRFLASNNGTRPGRDALVSIRAQGDFLILPSTDALDDNDEAPAEKPLEISSPPIAPRSRWQPRGFRLLTDSMVDRPGLRWPYEGVLPKLPGPRDPNAFYWKHRPISPESSFSLECEQWRHATDPAPFGVEIHCFPKAGQAKGLLECQIQAENLSQPAIHRVRVRIVIKQKEAFEIAQRLVQQRIRREQPGRLGRL